MFVKAKCEHGIQDSCKAGIIPPNKDGDSVIHINKKKPGI